MNMPIIFSRNINKYPVTMPVYIRFMKAFLFAGPSKLLWCLVTFGKVKNCSALRTENVAKMLQRLQITITLTLILESLQSVVCDLAQIPYGGGMIRGHSLLLLLGRLSVVQGGFGRSSGSINCFAEWWIHGNLTHHSGQTAGQLWAKQLNRCFGC